MSEDNNEDKELNPLEELEKALEEYEKRQRELTEATDEYLRKLKEQEAANPPAPSQNGKSEKPDD